MSDNLRRKCSRCGTLKMVHDFHRRRSSPTGREYACKDCVNSRQRARHALAPRPRSRANRKSLLKKYGITEAHYDALLTEQDHACAICRSPNPVDRWGRFHVDHDHATGLGRGLLCSNCNTCLGKFKDDASALRRAAAYIERWKDS